MALTVFDTDDKVMNALCAGASGYVLKNTPPARLLESLQEVAARRRPDVTRGRAPRCEAVPRVPAGARCHLSLDTSGDRAAEAARRRPSQEDGGLRDRHQREHRLVSPEAHLRETAGPLEDRGRRQSTSRAVGLSLASAIRREHPAHQSSYIAPARRGILRHASERERIQLEPRVGVGCVTRRFPWRRAGCDQSGPDGNRPAIRPRRSGHSPGAITPRHRHPGPD